jgi:7-cyano-7-deazaguanine synthase in queuosine biosynthesis
MCSIIKLKGNRGTISAIVTPYLKELLKIKGGDEFNVIIKNKGGFVQYITDNLLWEFKSGLDKALGNCPSEDIVELLLFSRLTPEMENTCSKDNLPQPYFNYLSNNKTIVAVHGTIPNAEEIAERHGFKINVDTEIFYHLPFEIAIQETEKAGGKICAIGLDSDTHMYHNGLGLFHYILTGDVEMTTNLDLSDEKLIHSYNNGTTKLHIHKKTLLDMGSIKRYDNAIRIISLFSGGLDITCSTQNVIEKYGNSSCFIKVKSIDLWYFDWGTRARDAEVQAGKDFTDYLNDKLFPDPEGEYFTDYVTHTVLPVKKAFKNILGICGLQGTRLTDDDATGAGSHEAESAISYVPYRNTILLTLAAARAEQLYPGENCIFVIGANLSEGMIYLDNSEPFVTAMNTLVKLGGQKSMYFEVQAPYVNRTKTAMIKDARSKHFRLDAFSCYFPVDGKECGSCGSCLLKQNALLRG